jgi:hypothetical protein
MLTSSPTWAIQDASKIQTYMACPREYFYTYVLGWRRVDPNSHLVFGEAWHAAMEQLLVGGYGDESLIISQTKLEEIYRRSFSEITDQDRYPKVPGFAAEMLLKYVKNYSRDHHEFETLYTETSGSVSIGPSRVVHFKTDSVLRGTSGFLKDKIFSLEHKTLGTLNRQWQQQWSLKQQVGVYTHFLYCLYDPASVYGIIINGAVFNKTKPDFIRLHVPKRADQMQTWLQNINFWYDAIERDFNRLAHASEAHALLVAFPMNSESCTKYFGCPYFDFCLSWSNPLQHLDALPVGYEVSHWDPRTIQTTHKMEITK